MSITDMDKELSAAIEQSISSPPTPRFRPGNGTESRRAVDQLSQATQGLLKVEEELNTLLAEITGHPDEAGKPSNPVKGESNSPALGLPMFDRVRADATALAELAIRMHAKINYARERL